MEATTRDSPNETELFKTIIEGWDLSQLLKLQVDLAKEIQRRVSGQQNQAADTATKTETQRAKIGGHQQLGQNQPELKYENERSDEFSLKNFTRKSLDKGDDEKATSEAKSSQIGPLDEVSIPGTLDMQVKEIDFSSPLKATDQPNATLQKFSPIKRPLAVISDSEGEIEWSETENSDANFSGSKKQRGEASKLDFNTNPATKKPWIFEDFMANETSASSRKIHSNYESAKVSKFRSAVGQPISNQKLVLHPDRGFEMVEESLREADKAFEGEVQFDNLRQRSDSPPGFGRLDFPNTQESLIDRMKSREILYNKTKARFLEAVRSDLRPDERLFLFRNPSLNEAVNSEDFQWNQSTLDIFSRE
ncbi:ssDNA endodeoxyribonuclease SAE2 [Lachancea thermotolerans CBS 6340]|uniref:KLTH0E07018p n=1 Tax=Lachancea thermotolerans (strain ATCC 56472 / CBS 6340 / NRRL Y-8284) TaxID=559295 RepID=C5DHT7_LACTC|nr:KLTH0E07018p [Lachancea thermotolerans CBS 6340]CAR23348.1 KLTH0E07018p [Lachancea thermotolerans CBS 6340]